MKKMCMVCGYTPIEGEIRECPNCGSYDLKIVKDRDSSSERFRRFSRI